MDEIKIFDDLYLLSSSGGNVPLTFNQYLLLGTEALLVHTGNHDQAEELVPKIKNLLGNRILGYIFISHFEGDECGGLSVIMKHFPKAKSLCSQVTARQLRSFGFTNQVVVKAPGEAIETNDYQLKFLSYPSEMHLWEPANG